MQSKGVHPMGGKRVLGGCEKGQVGRSYKAKKTITAVELTDDGKVKRMYAMRIEDFSARFLQ